MSRRARRSSRTGRSRPRAPRRVAAGIVVALLGLVGCGQPPPPAVERGFAAVDGGQLFYEIGGRGDPLVLIHGANLDHRMWDDQFDLLARRFRVLRYDARGFGRSSAPGSEFRSREDLRRLLDELGIRRAHLVGLSLGARIAVDFALEHPERVESLVLVGPNLSGWAFSAEDHAFVGKILAAASSGNVRQAERLWLESPYMAPAMEDARLAERLRQWSRDNERVWSESFAEIPLDPPATRRLSELRAPTLVVVGSRDVGDIHRIAEAITGDVPGAQRVAVEGAGHLVNLERPAEFNRLLLEFLSRVARAPGQPPESEEDEK